PDYNVLVWDLSLTELNGKKVSLDVFAYCEFSQTDWIAEAQWGYYTKLMVRTWYSNRDSSISYLNHQTHYRQHDLPLSFLCSSEPVITYSGDRNQFAGYYRDERNPQSVAKGRCDNTVLTAGEGCGALHNRVQLAPSGSKRLSFFLSCVSGATLDLPAAEKQREKLAEIFRKNNFIDEQFAKLVSWWDKHLSVYQAKLPDKEVQRQVNIWNPVNTVHTGRYSRAVNTVAPGIRGVGFRDTCQDMLAVAYRKPDWASSVFEYLLTQQYRDGHTVHYAYPEGEQQANVTLHSDNHLWLPLVLYAILAENGDYNLLNKKVAWLSESPRQGQDTGTVWEHMQAVVDYTENHLGCFGLPLTFKSDWNDIIGKFNKKGRGQTVFAGQQYVLALRYLIELAQKINDEPSIEKFKDYLHKQEQSLLKHGWDGQYWRRGFDDNGNPVGSSDCKEGKLFLNPQSWAVLSGTGTLKQQRAGMEQAAAGLETEVGLKLVTPGFSSWGGSCNSLIGYGAGTGENGAIFCHANTWAIIAQAILGNGTKAWEYFNKLLPQKAIKKVGLDRYQAEPYCWVSNIVGPENKRFGWANVTQVTGTATWMDVAVSQYLLGIRPTLNGLKIDPCLPPDWNKVSIKRVYRGLQLKINIDNSAGVAKGVKTIKINGEDLNLSGQSLIPFHLLKDKHREITVIMG
ncbi:MAG TPA: glycosyl hydrolase family 65 protein, partial [Spirochaetota bacterium]|nr:glycosyl hydrolase family 65 protein [Spirochaetota bacterium]